MRRIHSLLNRASNETNPEKILTIASALVEEIKTLVPQLLVKADKLKQEQIARQTELETEKRISLMLTDLAGNQQLQSNAVETARLSMNMRLTPSSVFYSKYPISGSVKCQGNKVSKRNTQGERTVFGGFLVSLTRTPIYKHPVECRVANLIGSNGNLAMFSRIRGVV